MRFLFLCIFSLCLLFSPFTGRCEDAPSAGAALLESARMVLDAAGQKEDAVRYRLRSSARDMKEAGNIPPGRSFTLGNNVFIADEAVRTLPEANLRFLIAHETVHALLGHYGDERLELGAEEILDGPDLSPKARLDLEAQVLLAILRERKREELADAAGYALALKSGSGVIGLKGKSEGYEPLWSRHPETRAEAARLAAMDKDALKKALETVSPENIAAAAKRRAALQKATNALKDPSATEADKADAALFLLEKRAADLEKMQEDLARFSRRTASLLEFYRIKIALEDKNAKELPGRIAAETIRYFGTGEEKVSSEAGAYDIVKRANDYFTMQNDTAKAARLKKAADAAARLVPAYERAIHELLDKARRLAAQR